MKKEYLQKFVVKVSDIIHLAVQFNVVLIVVKIKNMFAQNVILDFTLIVSKVIMKM